MRKNLGITNGQSRICLLTYVVRSCIKSAAKRPSAIGLGTKRHPGGNTGVSRSRTRGRVNNCNIHRDRIVWKVSMNVRCQVARLTWPRGTKSAMGRHIGERSKHKHAEGPPRVEDP